MARKQIKLVYEDGIITRDEAVSLFLCNLETEIFHIGNIRHLNSKCYDEAHREFYDGLERAVLAEVHRRS